LRKHVYDILVPVTYLHGDLKKTSCPQTHPVKVAGRWLTPSW